MGVGRRDKLVDGKVLRYVGGKRQVTTTDIIRGAGARSGHTRILAQYAVWNQGQHKGPEENLRREQQLFDFFRQ